MRASERAYEALREEIIEWRLLPGTVLAEVEQAERLGVSRTPLREALGRLTADGLTAPHRGRGVVVSEVSPTAITQLFELRHALETQAAALAAARREPGVFDALASEFAGASDLLATDDSGDSYYALAARLDAAIDDASDSAYLRQAIAALRLHLVRVRRLAKDNPTRLLASASEHATIASAIAAGNPALASAAVAIHLHQSQQYLMNILTTDKGPQL